jgi:hypothetical protein
MLLAPVLLLLPAESNASLAPCTDLHCKLQVYTEQPSPTTITTCDPLIYVVQGVYDRVKITAFTVDKATYRPGESLAYSGHVQVSEDIQYMNCYGQGYMGNQEVPPSQSNVQVQLLGGKFALTPQSDGSFGGTYSIPLTEPSTSYTAIATATFGTATDSASASFLVEAYQPVLSVTYATVALAAFPGENVLLVGNGWIPNMLVAVYVDDNFTTTSDSTGHFALTIPIPQEQPFQEGVHNITVTQANLVMTQSFSVRYHELIVTLNNLNSIAQGADFTASGNVTATETGDGVAGANVTILFMGKQFNATTDDMGYFKTDAIKTDPSTKPGSYTIVANATRRGFRPSKNAVQQFKVIPKLDLPAVTVAVASGAAVGAAVSLRGKLSKPSSKAPSLGPGTGSQPSMVPGSEQVVSKIGPGQQPSIGPGLSQSTQVGQRQIQAGPLQGPRASEFCIHCGSSITRGSKKCPDCGIRLR